MPGKANAQNLVSTSWLPDTILGLGNIAVNRIKGTCFFVFLSLHPMRWGKESSRGRFFTKKDIGESFRDLWVDVPIRGNNQCKSSELER